MPPTSLLRFRALPWLALLEVARTTKSPLDEHLSESDRKRVVSIAKRTKGDVRQLTEREKAELKRIARDLNVARLARDVGPAMAGMRRGRRR